MQRVPGGMCVSCCNDELRSGCFNRSLRPRHVSLERLCLRDVLAGCWCGQAFIYVGLRRGDSVFVRQLANQGHFFKQGFCTCTGV